MIDGTWIASKSLARMSIAAARVARDSIAWSVHLLKISAFFALSIAACRVELLAAGARGRCLNGDALRWSA